MLIDARSLPTGTEVETDLCIIGAGPAGLTIAKALGGKGIRTALLESGGPDFETEVNLLSEGEYTGIQVRSEEHTSELQSLMRLSYAVFCFKKKIINQISISKLHPIRDECALRIVI